MDTIFDRNPPVSIDVNPDGTAVVSLAMMPIDHRLMPTVMAMPSFPATFLAPLAAILVQWGTFERMHDELLFDLVAVNGSPAPIQRGFKRRRSRLREEIKLAFEPAGTAATRLTKALLDAGALHIDRNILAHGQLDTELKVNFPAGAYPLSGVKVSVVGSGEHKGLPVTRTYNMERLEQIFYAVAALSSAITEVRELPPEAPMSSLDIRTLQALRHTGYHSHPKPSKP